MSDDEISFDGNIFEEPEDFAPPPPEAHFTNYKRIPSEKQPRELKLRLVGASPLWGHLLWNAGIFTANYLDEHSESLVNGKKILELGAAASLPSIVCGLNSASKVISTDYPDPDLLSNIQYNFDNTEGIDSKSKIKVKGYIWGNDIRPLIYEDIEDEQDYPKEIKEDDKFDLIILSDLVFNHTEHHKLLSTCRQSVKKNGKCLIVFSPHRPHLLNDDLEFFKTCEEYDFKSEKIDLVNWTPMFKEDDETIGIRSRVYSFFLIPQWD